MSLAQYGDEHTDVARALLRAAPRLVSAPAGPARQGSRRVSTRHAKVRAPRHPPRSVCHVLAAGCAAMIVLLVISAWPKVEEILYRCRRNMLIGGIEARDLLLSPRPATRVRVSIHQEEQQLVADVEDNGRGLGAEQDMRPAGLGIIDMYERVGHAGRRAAI